MPMAAKRRRSFSAGVGCELEGAGLYVASRFDRARRETRRGAGGATRRAASREHGRGRRAVVATEQKRLRLSREAITIAAARKRSGPYARGRPGPGGPAPTVAEPAVGRRLVRSVAPHIERRSCGRNQRRPAVIAHTVGRRAHPPLARRGRRSRPRSLPGGRARAATAGEDHHATRGDRRGAD